MDIEHDRETTAGECIGRAGDVQVQALELVLVESLLRNYIFGQTKELLFVPLDVVLRTDGAARGQYNYVTVDLQRTRNEPRL